MKIEIWSEIATELSCPCTTIVVQGTDGLFIDNREDIVVTFK